MLHTIQEAILLTGLTRKTLYNHMGAGRVSYSVGADGRRYFETAELERCYGKLNHVTQPTVKAITQPYTLPVDHSELAQLLEKVIERAQAPLLARIASMEETLRRLEYKPDPEPSGRSAPPPGRAPGTHHTPAPPASKPKSFADLLSQLD